MVSAHSPKCIIKLRIKQAGKTLPSVHHHQHPVAKLAYGCSVLKSGEAIPHGLVVSRNLQAEK